MSEVKLAKSSAKKQIDQQIQATSDMLQEKERECNEKIIGF